MRLKKLMAILVLSVCAGLVAQAQENPFLGKWNIAGVAPHADYVYWLEVKEAGGKLSANFLNRSGSVLPISEIKLEGNELIFSPGGLRPGAPKPVHRAHVEEGRLLGLMTLGEEEQVGWIGERPPMWKSDYNANGRFRLGTPVVLFDGVTMEHWLPHRTDRELGWAASDGVMTNQPKANNLISKHRFQDFKIRCEYKVEDKSNSGIYLRGRYELQVLGDYGKPAESHGHMALYSRVAPAVNASLPPGQWQVMEATIVGNRLSVTLNGKKVHDNIVIEGITGGALDNKEDTPGPILIQGDHEKVWFRRVVVTPILN